MDEIPIPIHWLLARIARTHHPDRQPSNPNRPLQRLFTASNQLNNDGDNT